MKIKTFLSKKFLAVSGALVVLFVASTPSAVYAVPPIYQSVGIAGYSSSTCISPSTYNLAFPSGEVTAGNLLIVTVGYKGNYNTIPTPTDSQSNTYTRITDGYVNAGSNSSRGIATFYTVAGSSGSNTVTVVCPEDSGLQNAVILPLLSLHQITGADTSDPIDAAVFSYGSSNNTVTPGSSLSAVDGDLYFMAMMSVNHRDTVDDTSGWFGVGDTAANRGSIYGFSHFVEDFSGPVGSYGSFDLGLTGSSPSTTQWAAIGMMIKPQ